MQVYELNPLRDPRWAEFVRGHSRSSVFHTPEWLSSIHQTYAYQPVVFTTSSPGDKLQNGLVLCRIHSWLTGSRLVSLPFSDHCEPLVDSAAELDFLLHFLQADMAARHWKYVELRPIDGRFESNARQANFRSRQSYFLHRVDIRSSLEEIFDSVHKGSVQRRIQHAEKAGVECRCGRSNELLTDFYKLLVLTRKRHLAPPQPHIWFRNLLDCMGEKLDIGVAYKENCPIAAILTLRFRNTTYYKYACSDARFHNLGAMPALVWNTIRVAKESGSEELDLGRSECENKGLVAFKDHWTRNRTALVYWRKARTAHASSRQAWKLGGWKLRMAKRTFACVPNRMLPIMGRLLYRHAG